MQGVGCTVACLFLLLFLFHWRKSLDVAKMGFENEITKVAIKDVEETLQVMKDRVGPRVSLVGFREAEDGKDWKRG